MATREIRSTTTATTVRILDEAARDRRRKKALEALEQDNFQEEPYAGLGDGRKKGVIQFQEPVKQVEVEQTKKKKIRPVGYFKNKYRISWQQLLEDEQFLKPEGPNYFTAEAPPSSLPKRHFCGVCGFPALYTCAQCGTKYCQARCLSTHKDTRCLKWTT